DADEQIFAQLDRGIESKEAAVRRAAVAEYSRWTEEKLPEARRVALASPRRVRRLLEMGMRDDNDSIRDAAAKTAFALDAAVAVDRFLRALEDKDAAKRC